MTVQRTTMAHILVALLLLLSGCAGHSKKTLEARQALDAGSPERAMTLYNKVLKVKNSSELPDKKRKNADILVLDRSMISQQLGNFQDSSRDLEHADKAVEMLDMSRTAVADIGKYLFSDDTGPYKGAPYEKVMINTMNMVNYLARHDLNGARIEARRLAIIQKYLTDNKHPAEEMNAPGAYLAGFVFEKSGRPDIALRYYDEALKHGDFPSLAKPIAELHGGGSYSTPRLREFLKKHGAGPPTVPAPPPSKPPATATESDAEQSEAGAEAENSESAPSNSPSNLATVPPRDPGAPGDLLVIVSYGRVPAKIAKRIPIGLALTYASASMTGPNQNTANRLAGQGLVTWVNYPELEETYRRLPPPSLSINGQSFSTETLGAIDTATRKAYDKVRGAIIASAITRMITRIVAGESLGAAARGASDNNIVGALVSLGTQAALTAADTPDTRSWVTLPARIEVARLRLKPGRHRVVLSAQGQTKTFDVNMEAGGWEVVTLTSLR